MPRATKTKNVTQEHQDTATLEADHHQAVHAMVAFHDLVPDADDRPPDVVRGHDCSAFHRIPSVIGITCQAKEFLRASIIFISWPELIRRESHWRLLNHY